MTATGIVGRKAEVGAIDAFLDRVATAAAAIAFEGEPGIGKTTVWRELAPRAAERACTLLACRAAEAEAKLAFAAVADLFDPVADAILPRCRSRSSSRLRWR